MKLSKVFLGIAGVAGAVSEVAGTVCVISTLRNQQVNEKAAKVALGTAGVSGAAAAVGYFVGFKECVNNFVDTLFEAVDNLEDDELFDEFNPEDEDFVEEELNEEAIDEIMNHEPVDRSQA